MSADQANQVAPSPTCMESVNRIVKLPVVESTIQTATSVYGKVKVNTFIKLKAIFFTNF